MYSIKNIISFIKILRVLYCTILSKYYLEVAVSALKEHEEELYDEYAMLYSVYREKAKVYA